jgi:hypothetical protein
MRTAAPARTNRKRSRVIVPETHMLELVRLYDETSEAADREGAGYRRAEAGGRGLALKRHTMCRAARRSIIGRLRTGDEHEVHCTDQIQDRPVSP